MRPSAWQKSSLTATAERYHKNLDEETLAYLAARGIDQDAASGFLLGVVGDPEPAHEQYAGRLSLPHITPTGVVTMRFRCLEDHVCSDNFHGKYEGLAGEETRLYNVMALHQQSDVIAITVTPSWFTISPRMRATDGATSSSLMAWKFSSTARKTRTRAGLLMAN